MIPPVPTAMMYSAAKSMKFTFDQLRLVRSTAKFVAVSSSRPTR